ncbi:MAG: hypothetical protein K1X67_20090 [Fimbriimonadaceae bacterium]|nr:hypothetical protein [Fimbriimonadaceae bacterium]
MSEQLQEKKANRFRLLRKLYEMTDGVPERHSINIREVGKSIGIDPEVALDTFEYLKGEGLTVWMSLGGFGTITHWGVREIEEALEGRQTGHFPANIVVITGSSGVNVVSGSGNTVTQSQEGSSGLSVLRAEFESIGGTDDPVVKALFALLESPQQNPFDVARHLSKIVSKGNEWRSAVQSAKGRLQPIDRDGLLGSALSYVLENTPSG